MSADIRGLKREWARQKTALLIKYSLMNSAAAATQTKVFGGIKSGYSHYCFNSHFKPFFKLKMLKKKKKKVKSSLFCPNFLLSSPVIFFPFSTCVNSSISTLYIFITSVSLLKLSTWWHSVLSFALVFWIYLNNLVSSTFWFLHKQFFFLCNYIFFTHLIFSWKLDIS